MPPPTGLHPTPKLFGEFAVAKSRYAINYLKVIYRATDVAAPGTVLHPSTRNIFTQAFASDQDVQTFGRVEDTTLMRPEEVQKEMMVVVKRGTGVDYAEKEGSPYLSIGAIRREGQTWSHIKAQQDTKFKQFEYLLTHDDDESGDDDESDDDDDAAYSDDDDHQTFPWRQPLEKNVIVDTYSHVDEYTWPPLYF